MQPSFFFYSDDDVDGEHSLRARMGEWIRARGDRVGYIASSPDPDRVHYERQRATYEGLRLNLCVYLDSETPDPKETLAALTECSAIHLSGGNTYAFLNWLRSHGAMPVLRDFVHNGGILIGVSAGAILMTPSVASAALCGDTPFSGALDKAALGVVDFQFWPHYSPGAEDNPVAQAFLKKAALVYACPDGAGLMLQQGRVELYGDVRTFRYGRCDS